MSTHYHVDEQLWKDQYNPACQCNKPLMIVIPPGRHIHPCPVHPDVAIYGQNIMC